MSTPQASVERFARVFVDGPEELPVDADSYCDPHRGHYFKFHLDGVPPEAAGDVIRKARDKFDIEIVRRVRQGPIYKERVYIEHPDEAPEDARVQYGEQGGLYYETGLQSVAVQEGETRNVAVILWDDMELGDEIVFEAPDGNETFAEIVDIADRPEEPVLVEVEGEVYEAVPGTYTVDKSEGSVTSGTPGVHSAVYSRDEDEEEEDEEDVGKEAQWVSYEGPRGGQGWQNTQTGEVVYQEEPPGETEGSDDDPDDFDPAEPPDGGYADGWDAPPDDHTDLEPGQSVELYRDGAYLYAEVVDAGMDGVTVEEQETGSQVTVGPDEITAQGESEDGIEWSEADPEAFSSNVKAFIEDNPEMGAFLTEHDPEELEDHTLLTADDGSVGVSVSPEGDVQNLYNHDGPKGAGRDALEAAIEHGGITLDCYDGYLRDLYGEYGFRETGRIEFDPDYAPDGWNFEEYGQPDVVFMSLQPEEELEETETYYEPDEWGRAKQDSRGAADTGRDGGEAGGGVRGGERGDDPGSGAAGRGPVEADIDRLPEEERDLVESFISDPTWSHYLRSTDSVVTSDPRDYGLKFPPLSSVFYIPEEDTLVLYPGFSEDVVDGEGVEYQDAEELMVHEIGHAGHEANLKEEGLNRFDLFDGFQYVKEHADTIREDVSDYAMQDESEFVAEVFTRLARGDDVTEETREAYELMHGPAPPDELDEASKAVRKEEGVWTFYYGPQGGEGWLNLQTGEIRYQQQRPGPGPEGGDGHDDFLAEGWEEPPEEITDLKVGQTVEVEGPGGDYHEAEVRSVADAQGEPAFNVETESGKEWLIHENNYHNITAVADPQSRHDPWFDGSEFTEEEYWEAFDEEIPEDADPLIQQFELGEPYEVELPGGNEVELPFFAYTDGDPPNDDVPVGEEALVAHYDDLEAAVGEEDMHKYWGEPGEASPTVTLPVEAIPDMVVDDRISVVESDERATDEDASDGPGTAPSEDEASEAVAEPLSEDPEEAAEELLDEFPGYDPGAVVESRDLASIGANHGNSMSAKEVHVMPDGSEWVHTDLDHNTIEEEDGRRQMAGYEALKHLYDHVPDHVADFEEGWFANEVAPGVDAKDATPGMRDAVDAADFVDMAATQVLIGNADAHQNNVRVDEEGNLYPFDLDRSGGDVQGEWSGNLPYENTLDRILGELEKTATALDVEMDRHSVLNRAREIVEGLDGPTQMLIQEEASDWDEELSDTIAQNIVAIAEGEVDVP